MKRLMLAATMLACACTQPAEAPPALDISEGPHLDAVTLPAADGAGNRMEALTQSGDRWCTSDGAWCVSLTESVSVAHHGSENIALPTTERQEDGRWSLWQRIVRAGRNDERVLVGLIWTTTQMYSGGGGSASALTLYEVANGAAREATTLPFGGAADVRACFDEEDEQQRAGACRDMYTFVTRVSVDESVTSGPPRIVLETAAGSYPGRVTRNADSLEARALEPSDLVWARDDVCSFRRTFSRSSAGAYVPDAELPACTDYLEP